MIGFPMSIVSDGHDSFFYCCFLHARDIRLHVEITDLYILILSELGECYLGIDISWDMRTRSSCTNRASGIIIVTMLFPWDIHIVLSLQSEIHGLLISLEWLDDLVVLHSHSDVWWTWLIGEWHISLQEAIHIDRFDQLIWDIPDDILLITQKCSFDFLFFARIYCSTGVPRMNLSDNISVCSLEYILVKIPSLSLSLVSIVAMTESEGTIDSIFLVLEKRDKISIQFTIFHRLDFIFSIEDETFDFFPHRSCELFLARLWWTLSERCDTHEEEHEKDKKFHKMENKK